MADCSWSFRNRPAVQTIDKWLVPFRVLSLLVRDRCQSIRQRALGKYTEILLKGWENYTTNVYTNGLFIDKLIWQIILLFSAHQLLRLSIVMISVIMLHASRPTCIELVCVVRNCCSRGLLFELLYSILPNWFEALIAVRNKSDDYNKP